MKKTKTESAYQKMLLVTPLVYQKLLNCIDEKDKVSTEELNLPRPEMGGDKTPSEKIIEGISDIDVGIQTAPETAEMGVQVEPQTGDPTIAGTDMTPMQPISTQTDYPEPIVEDEFVPDVSNNPLKNQCQQDTNEGSIIPSLFYRPSLKARKLPQKWNKTVYSPKPSPLKQVTFAEPVGPYDFNPPLDPYTETRPPLEQDVLSIKRPLSQNMRPSSFQHPKFPCSVCGHSFTRKHDLQRHLASRTVHKNLNLKTFVKTPTTKPIILPPTEHVNADEGYEFWDDPTSKKPSISPKKSRLIVPPISKSMDTSKPTVLGKRSHSKAKLGNLRYPRKLMKENPVEQEEFDSWTF